MKRRNKIRMIVVLIFAVMMAVIFIQECSDYSSKIQIQSCSIPQQSSPWLILILSIVGSFPVAWLVVYLTTRADREGRKFVRGKIADGYVDCQTISKTLMEPEGGKNSAVLLSRIVDIMCKSMHMIDVHSSLLNANEVEKYRKQKEYVVVRFIPLLSNSPENRYLLNEFMLFWRTILTEYVKTHEIESHYEYTS